MEEQKHVPLILDEADTGSLELTGQLGRKLLSSGCSEKHCLRKGYRAGEVTQQVRLLVIKAWSSEFHVCAVVCMHIGTNNKCKELILKDTP